MANKRIILVGPTASGKTFLRKKLEEKGFHFDVSYTTRKPRDGEEYGVHYNFISEEEFILRVSQDAFYEHVNYNGCRYGTGRYEWNNSDGFIMETAGIKHISPEDRKNSFIIYLNPPVIIRMERMAVERGWGMEEIEERLKTDNKKFKDFNDYDMIITEPNF